MARNYDYLIVGAGIIGLTIARELKRRLPDCSVGIIEKEDEVALHASGRNSGVLHSGFYYSADSLKARFTREGNLAMTAYCEENGLKLNRCGKVVVATSGEELAGLDELKRRGDRNGVELIPIDEKHLFMIEPNARTVEKALFCPTTSTVDPIEVCRALKREIVRQGVDILFSCPFKGHRDRTVYAGNDTIEARYLVNSAGLYADAIAKQYGFGGDYTIIPFKGIYMKYKKNKTDIRTNIYPVPNLNNPFLGVHFTKTFDGSIKIGPTAIPALWRENYNGLRRLSLPELSGILYYESKLFLTNSFRFRSLALGEVKKYMRNRFINESLKLVRNLDKNGFGEFMRPGIRAQLLNKKTMSLVQDFIVEGDDRSLHVLNSVSPAFTCSLPFAEYIVKLILEKQDGGRVAAG
ncbi:L-2-hydroxyglutarate oxidase [Cohnella fermenti]|uniref:L-2-hydroxyglutarate oxidase n=1 Tax=Cohnella fermenti TaxID=2565925 RepID=A0A4S4BKA4_9BACL|nr:L-2-hydroxyglutarate oxidase [Cohnella fermenti]THF74900.1 L-2-hydroxyglutarate oxidase [Cohnella fermenti]